MAVYVLEGTLTIFWGSEKKEAVAGSYFFQPRGTPHGFRVEGATPARILYMTIPAGLDRFVIEQELLAPNPESATAAARYKIEILGRCPNDLAMVTQSQENVIDQSIQITCRIQVSKGVARS